MSDIADVIAETVDGFLITVSNAAKSELSDLIATVLEPLIRAREKAAWDEGYTVGNRHNGTPRAFAILWAAHLKVAAERDEADAEVARLTAVVQGVREIADEHWDWKAGQTLHRRVKEVLAGGTDTPKGEGDE